MSTFEVLQFLYVIWFSSSSVPDENGSYQLSWIIKNKDHSQVTKESHVKAWQQGLRKTVFPSSPLMPSAVLEGNTDWKRPALLAGLSFHRCWALTPSTPHQSTHLYNKMRKRPHNCFPHLRLYIVTCTMHTNQQHRDANTGKYRFKVIKDIIRCTLVSQRWCKA